LETGAKDIHDDFSKFGWWNQPEFFPGMFMDIDPIVVEENKKKVKKVIFKGLISIYRPYRNTTQAPNTLTRNMNSNLKSNESSRKLTFVSIGVDNNEFYDCVLWGIHKLKSVNIIYGEGLYHFNDISPWIEVKKFKVKTDI
jgi:hypothetical protein